MSRHPRLHPFRSDTPQNDCPIPDYLKKHYSWAYIHPWAVKVFERQWLINLILLGQYNTLRDALTGVFMKSPPRKLLQVACAYGNLSHELLQTIPDQGQFDLIDVLPIQLQNAQAHLPQDPRCRLYCMDASALHFEDSSYDAVVLFFLLHEVPAEVREKILKEAERVLTPQGRLIIVDYSKPHWWHPFRYTWRWILEILEPFSRALFAESLPTILLSTLGQTMAIAHQQTFLGRTFELVVLTPKKKP